MPEVRAKYVVPAAERTKVLERVCAKLSTPDVIYMSLFNRHNVFAEGILAEPTIAFVNLSAYGNPNVARWSVSRHQNFSFKLEIGSTV
jgi:hypothetical protein